MANRPVIRRRSVVAEAQPEPVKAKLVMKKASKPVVEDDGDEDEDIDVEDIDDEDEEEEVHRSKKAAPAPAMKKAAPAPVKAAAKKVEEEPEEEEEEPEEEQSVKTVKVKPVEATIAGAMLLDLVAGMENGNSISITKTADNKWIIANSTQQIAVKKGLTGNEYWQEVQDPKHAEWDAEWHSLTQDERLKKVKKAGVTWVEDKDPRVNIMRATQAYKEAMGIEKYKQEYRTRAARAAIRGG